MLQEGGVPLITESPSPLQLSHNHPGVDTVDSDLLGGQLQSNTPGELIQGSLGYIVGKNTSDKRIKSLEDYNGNQG